MTGQKKFDSLENFFGSQYQSRNRPENAISHFQQYKYMVCRGFNLNNLYV